MKYIPYLFITLFLMSCKFDTLEYGSIISKEIIPDFYIIEEATRYEDERVPYIDFKGNLKSRYDTVYVGSTFTEYYHPREYKLTIRGYTFKKEKEEIEWIYVTKSFYDSANIYQKLKLRTLFTKWYKLHSDLFSFCKLNTGTVTNRIYIRGIGSNRINSEFNTDHKVQWERMRKYEK